MMMMMMCASGIYYLLLEGGRALWLAPIFVVAVPIVFRGLVAGGMLVALGTATNTPLKDAAIHLGKLEELPVVKNEWLQYR